MNIVVIDLWNVFHIEWHAGTNKDARYPFRETMGRIRAIATQYDFCAIMTDGPPSFRADLDSRWKANRAEKETGLFAQLAEVERQLEAEGFHVFKAEGFEADDLIATAVNQLMRAVEPGQAEIAITINSGDRDLLSLLEPGVRMLKTTAPHAIVQADDVRNLKNIGVDPPKIRDFLVLCDKHNGVKYFDGIGPVHAARLLNQFGDLRSIIAAVDNRVPDSDQYEVHPPAVRQSIKNAIAGMVDGRPLLDVAMQIVTLRTDAPIDIKKIFQKREPKVIEAAWETIDEQDAQADEGGQGDRAVGQATTKGAKIPGVVVEPMGVRDRTSLGAREVSEVAPKKDPAAMTVVPRWELALEPAAIQDAWRLASRAAESGFWPKHGGPPGCMMIIMAGRSRNLTAFDALNGMHIIEGKPCYGAYLLIGMVQAHPSVEYFELAESDEKHALWIAKRKKSKLEQRRLYTIDQAKAAGLVRETYNGKASNWQKNPEDMLIKTAGAKLTRGPFAYITSGAVAAEEMGYE